MVCAVGDLVFTPEQREVIEKGIAWLAKDPDRRWGRGPDNVWVGGCHCIWTAASRTRAMARAAGTVPHALRSAIIKANDSAPDFATAVHNVRNLIGGGA